MGPNFLTGDAVMTDTNERERDQQEADTLRTQEREGHGLVPNAAPEETQGKTGELKKAFHDLEEKKGDWAKDR
jgi:hypothetical protein